MSRMAKRIVVNKVKLIDKVKMKAGELPGRKPLKTAQIHYAMKEERAANIIDKDTLDRLISIARAHALWLSMSVLKDIFKLSGKNLVEYCTQLRDVYKYAFDNASAKDIEKAVKYIVRGNPKEEWGAFGMEDFEFMKFDGDDAMKKIDSMGDISAKRQLHLYNRYERTFLEFSKAEVAEMLVLHDKFGFRKKRLARFIEAVRSKYEEGVGNHFEIMSYLEKLCKVHIKEFDCIRAGQGIFDPA